MGLSHIAEPKPAQKHPWVRRLKARERAQLKICEPSPQWIVTHWVASKGTVACEANRGQDGKVIDNGDCAACRTHEPERVRGYLYCWNEITGRHEFLELTLNVWLEIKAQSMHMSDRRGWSLTVWRGNGPKARIQVEMERPPLTEGVGDFPFVPSVDASIKALTRR